ncbi:hypothetical protein HOH87_07445 [bacterium]|nr:hypothetical protein [bacterium]
MIRSLLLLWVLIGLTSGSYAKVAPIISKTPITYIGVPLAYDHHIYFSDSETLTKTTSEGQSLWELSLINPKRSLVTIKFNQVFLLDTLGQLNVYGADLGNALWTYKKRVVKALHIAYPNTIIHTKGKALIGIHFFTGHVLWRNTTHKWKSFQLIKKQLYAQLPNGKWELLDTSSGRPISKKVLEPPELNSKTAQAYELDLSKYEAPKKEECQVHYWMETKTSIIGFCKDREHWTTWDKNQKL